MNHGMKRPGNHDLRDPDSVIPSFLNPSFLLIPQSLIPSLPQSFISQLL
jgi:hypothetical protein